MTEAIARSPVKPQSSASAPGLALILLAGMFLRLAGALLFPTIGVYDDERTYAFLSDYVHQHFVAGAEKPWTYSPWGNVGGVLRMVYDDPFILRLTNILLGLLSAVVLYDGFRRWRDLRGAATPVFAAVLLSPLAIFVSILALKEEAISFGLILVAVSPLYPFLFRIGLAAAGCAALLYLRFDIGVVATLAVLGHLLLGRLFGQAGADKVGLRRLALGAILLLVTAYAAVGITGKLQTTGIRTSKAGQFIAGVGQRGDDTIRANRKAYFNRVASSADVMSPRNLVLAPLRAVYAPTPVALPVKAANHDDIDWSDVVQALLAVVIYIITPAAFVGLTITLRDTRLFLVGAMFLIVFLASALSALSVAPEMFRYRWPALTLFVALAAIGRRMTPFARLCATVWWISVIAAMVLYVWANVGIGPV